MALEIKKLGAEDFRLAKLLFLFFQVDDGVENPTSASDDYIKKLLSSDDFHVVAAMEDESLVGGLTAYELTKYKREAKEMFLYEIGVEETHRRKGIGRGLIECLKKICAEKEIPVIFVATEMDNESAKYLYQATGGQFEATAIYTFQLD
jgi:aminoglycoside 3-N-acetyltransferase I